MSDVHVFPLVEIQPPAYGVSIVAAAVKLGDSMYTAWRHSDILAYLGRNGTPQRAQDAQGFIADNGSFYNRYQSARIAFHAQQIPTIPNVLTSEDLWDIDGTPRKGGPYDPMGDSQSGAT